MFATCLKRVWNISGTCLKRLYNMAGVSLEHKWHMSTTCLTHVWNIPKIYPTPIPTIWKLNQQFQNFAKMFWNLLKLKQKSSENWTQIGLNVGQN